ncbi:hypothetical protein OB955_19615 [Halobacteria archaeon AArc-m2/3/4]|uniref:SipW-cognate class signal peptide n=1 Tax=Natronoglomus mannanivorans TaxID=2979990 RepID=A0ABT2QJ56_9EURY|nr:hypothetical protein [Halobacteria archaeon AArc-m2/3/4]
MGKHDRRSFLTTLGMSGLLSATGIATGATSWSDTEGGTDSTAIGRTDDYVLGVEVINRETGDRSFYATREAVSRADLEPGVYDVVELVRDGDLLTQRVDQISVTDDETHTRTGTVGTMSEVDIDLRVTTATATQHGHVAPDGTIPVLAGALELADENVPQPSSDVDVTLTLEDPDGEDVTTRTASTGSDGNVHVDVDLADLETDVTEGEYTVRVESEATDSTDSATVAVGPYTVVPPHLTGLTVGDETTIGVYSDLGGELDDETRDIVVTAPDGDQQTTALGFENGIGMLPIEPSQTGTYGIRGEATAVIASSYSAPSY